MEIKEEEQIHEVSRIESHFNTTIKKGKFKKTLEENRLCQFQENSKFACNDLKIVAGRAEERKTYQFVQIDIEPIQKSGKSH